MKLCGLTIARGFSTVRKSLGIPAYGSVTGSYRLKIGHDLHYTMHGDESASTTVVMIHGAPGSANDFKYLAPLLVEKNPQLKVIALDLPGNGRSSGLAAGGPYSLTADTVAEAATEAIQGIVKHQPCIILGHSFGGHTALLAAEELKNAHGVVLLCSVGLNRKPYEKFARPASQLLRSPGLLQKAVIAINHWRYMNLFKFPKSTPKDDLTYALLRLGSTNFDRMEACVKSLRERRLPSFVAYATDDFVVSAKATKYLGDQLYNAVQIAYPKGGHNIQKTQAEDLTQALTEWTNSILK